MLKPTLIVLDSFRHARPRVIPVSGFNPGIDPGTGHDDPPRASSALQNAGVKPLPFQGRRSCRSDKAARAGSGCEYDDGNGRMNAGRQGNSVILRFFSAALKFPPVLPPRVVDERLVLCFGAAMYMLILFVAPQLLKDPDTLWHIKLGEVIFATGHVPRVDTFSYTMAGADYHDMQWLSQVPMNLCYRMGGYAAVAMLSAFAAAAAFAILYRELARRLNELTAFALVGLAFLLCLTHLLCRPHTLVSPILVLWTACLIRSAESGRSPSLWLLPFMTIWANMHASFLLGLVLIAPFAIEAALRRGQQRAAAAAKWAGFGVLALAAAAVSPYGIEQISAPFRIFDLGSAANLIGEMQPQDFSNLEPFEMVLLLGLAAALLSGVVAPLTRIAVLLGLFHMALSHMRHADLFGILGVLVLAEPIAQRFKVSGRQAIPTAWVRFAVPVVGIAAALQTALAFQNGAIRPPANIVPEAAFAAAMAEGMNGRLLNDFNFGGYLISIGAPTFIDGRAEFFGADRLTAYIHALRSSGPDELAQYLDENRINWTLLEPGRPAVRTLDHMPGWRRVYADATAVVHARSTSICQGICYEGRGS